MSTASASSESKLSINAAEFVPLTENYSFQGVEGTGENATEDDDVSGPFTETDTAMRKLLNNPEAFFEVVNPLVKSLSTSIKNAATLNTIMEHIFQQSIFQDNYQYTGARLCNSFSQKLTQCFEDGNFRTILMHRCLTEYYKRKELSKTEAGLQELVGFTLFLAELMLNLQGESILKALGPKLIDLLSELLSVPNERTIKGVNKTLKLAGSALESSTPDKMNEVFGKLKDVIVENETSKELRKILVHLVILRAQKWDQTTEATSVQKDNASNIPEPVFHDENGELVYEDYAGETDGCNYSGYANYEYAPEDDVSDELRQDYEAWIAEQENEEVYNVPPYVEKSDDMDPDMDDAYEQFLAQLDPSSSNSGK